MVLGADYVVMSDTSELGPIDRRLFVQTIEGIAYNTRSKAISMRTMNTQQR